MTPKQYKILQAAWVAFCVALIGGVMGFLLNWQFGLLAGGVAVFAVAAMTYGPDAKSNMWNGRSMVSEDCESSDSWLISDESFDDPGWSSVAGNVWHD